MPVLLYVLAVAVFAQGTSEFVLAGLVPGISTGLGVSLAQASYLTSGFAVGMVVGAPLTAAVGRRLPPRSTLSACLLVFVAAHVVGALADQFAVLLVTRFVAAVANAGFLAVALSTVTIVVPAGRQARALAAVLGGTTLALIAGVPAGALLGEVWGWRSALWAIAGVSAVALVAVVCLTPGRLGPRSPEARVEPPAGTELRATAEPRARVDLRSELSALRSPDLQRYLVLGVLVNAATFCAFTFLAAIVTDGAGLDPALVPLVLALFGLGAFAGVSAAGRLADAHGRLVLGVGAPLLVAGWALWAAFAASPQAAWVFAPVLGALSFAVGGTLIARTMAAAHSAPTMGGAYSTVALNLGALTGPVLGGLAITALGPTAPLVISATLAATATAVALTPAPRAR
ncbi:DHA1 family chloramphenicol resistance protein-like MFS transporter [Promicromonospora sp. AC04]|uniref:Cmx/CmrA family chloramphenicol efflux MFS transporter n=1 Tax=Promicromonospora sp. AC04 TaxID=2135723 RepID=UPI000D3586BE|nr:Cmx/CmrA family chloramphenicol efflux MFS transporter [Promicromonospora sp. AC04]PUB26299.1 DHA1 family chloramphenicol resistance protein-like MFS transporter [Promicromonospora sp. AC04]